MFTDLAFVDWLALVFAAVLLAAASAAAVIALATSSARPKPLFSLTRRRRTSGSQDETTEDDNDVAPTWVEPPAPSVRPLHTERQPSLDSPAHAAPGHRAASAPALEADAGVAARAAKLRRRPIPETTGLQHRKRIQSVVSNHTQAHVATLDPTSIGVRSGVSSGNFDSTEGFKARNPGFFEDPMGRHELRYWDGHSWTEYVKEHGERFTDPL